MKFTILLSIVTIIGFELGVDFLAFAVPLTVLFSVVTSEHMQDNKWKSIFKVD
jgi:hypothetical protein